MADFKDTGLIMSGDIFMAEVDADGKFGALNGPMNVPSLSITPTSVNRISRPSFQKDNYGQALDAVNLPSDSASVTIQFDSMPAAMLAETSFMATTSIQSVNAVVPSPMKRSTGQFR